MSYVKQCKMKDVHLQHELPQQQVTITITLYYKRTNVSRGEQNHALSTRTCSGKIRTKHKP